MTNPNRRANEDGPVLPGGRPLHLVHDAAGQCGDVQAAGRLGGEAQTVRHATVGRREQLFNLVRELVGLADGRREPRVFVILLLSGEVVEQVQVVEVPSDVNVTAVYPIAILNDAPNPQTAQAFVDFVLSDAGQAILAKWGFGSVNGG